MAYSAMTTAETDADSPLNTALFTKIKDNFIAIFDGTNIETDLVDQGAIAAASVGTGELVISTLSGAIACGAAATNLNLGQQYTHLVYISWARLGGTGASWRHGVSTLSSLVTNVCYFRTNGDGSSPNPANYSYGANYHAACPPHTPFMAGGKCCGEWGSFVHIFRGANTGRIYGSWMAPDPFWFMGARAMSELHSAAPEAIDRAPFPDFSIEDVGEPIQAVMLDTREHCLERVQFSVEAIKADRLRRKLAELENVPRGSITTAEGLLLEREGADMLSKLEARASRKSKEMSRRDALQAEAVAFGRLPIDLMMERMPKTFQSDGPHTCCVVDTEATENQKSIKTGVPAFDDNVKILRAQ